MGTDRGDKRPGGWVLKEDSRPTPCLFGEHLRGMLWPSERRAGSLGLRDPWATFPPASPPGSLLPDGNGRQLPQPAGWEGKPR